ncbi:CGNR zinc finger domain-containing protein [Dongia sp. agr-C8]
MTKRDERLLSAYSGMAIETGHVWTALDLVGGLPCLDFANTAGGHSKIREVERIPTYQDAINWALFAEILSAGEARGVAQAAKAKPGAAARQVEAMHVFREALQRTVAAISSGQPVVAKDFAKVRAVITEAVGVAEIAQKDEAFLWTADAAAPGLGTVLTRVALSAHDMFAREKPSQLRVCERCTWVFIDRTKNQRRRFCRQDACGNKARAARFYHLHKA